MKRNESAGWSLQKSKTRDTVTSHDSRFTIHDSADDTTTSRHTGIGAITPIGLGREGLWNGLRAEKFGGWAGHPLRSVAVPLSRRGRSERLRADRSPGRAAQPAFRPLRAVFGGGVAHGAQRRGHRRSSARIATGLAR